MPDTPQPDKKHTFSDIWRNPYSQDVLLPLDAQAVLKKQIKLKLDAERDLHRLLDQGWRRQSEIAEIINDEQKTLSAKILNYHKNGNYTPAGLSPSGSSEEALVKGSELRWQHPIEKITLLRPELAQGLIVADEERKRLIAQRYELQSDLVKKLSVSDIQLSGKTKKIQENESYLTNGQKPQGLDGEQVIRGDLLRWQHPYKKQIVLLHPDYAAALTSQVQSRKIRPKKMPIINREEADHEMGRLLGAGWVPQFEVANSIAVAPCKLSRRTKNIQPDDDYLSNGQKSGKKAEEQTVKGNQLRWQHPYDDKKVLLSKEYSQALITAEEERKKLVEKGYQSQSKVAREAQITVLSLAQRNRNILPDAYYLLNGLTPENDLAKEKIIGSQLCWRHPYERNIILLHPDYAKAIIDVAEKYRTLKLEGYQLQSEISKDATHSVKLQLSNKTRKIHRGNDYLPNGNQPTGAPGEIILKGAQLRWQHPYDKDLVLLHPDFARSLQQEFSIKDQANRKRAATLIPCAEADQIQQNLLKQKYRLLSEVAEQCQVDRRKLSISTLKTTKDSQLRWLHPYTKNVLLHPNYAELLIAGEKKQKELENLRYALQSKVERGLGMHPRFLAARTSRIKQDKYYLTNGLDPTGASGEITIKGSELRWQHPYKQQIVLLHPDYVTALIEEWKRNNPRVEGTELKDKSLVDTVISKGASPEAIGVVPNDKLPTELADKLEANELDHEAKKGLQ